MTTRSLTTSLFLALGLTAGCAATTPGVPGDPGSGVGSGSDDAGSGSASVPLTAEGKFAVKSDYDIEANMPGTAGDVVRAFIAATDDPDDPTHWILDQMIAQMPDGFLKDAVSDAEPFVAGYLNDRLLDVAPDFVTNIVDFGDKFGQMAKHFGTIDELDVGANGSATHIVRGVHFKVDGEQLDFLFADYGMQEVSVPNVAVTLSQTGQLTVASHDVDLSYGAMLKLGVDNVVIPLIDPSATTIGDVLHDWVNCQAVGEYVYEAIGVGSPSTYESACDSGLTVGGNFIYSQIDNIDGAALEFGIAGTAKGVDKNGDGKIDTIQTGKWSGTLSYAGTPAPLAAATFTGSRM